jgi:hypothetical protein
VEHYRFPHWSFRQLERKLIALQQNKLGCLNLANYFGESVLCTTITLKCYNKLFNWQFKITLEKRFMFSQNKLVRLTLANSFTLALYLCAYLSFL